jgi:hypothetical protein
MRENGRCGGKKLLKNFTRLRSKISLNCGLLEAIFSTTYKANPGP